MPTAAPPKKAAKKTSATKTSKKATAGGVRVEREDPAKNVGKPHVTKSTDEKAYKAKIAEIQERLSALAERSEKTTWEHASLAYYSMKELEREFDKPKEKFYEDLADGHPWAAATIKKAVLTCGKLETAGHVEIFTQPHTGYTQVCDILNASKLSEDARGSLLVKVYKHDRQKPDEKYTVQQVRGFLADLAPPDEQKVKWLRGTDLWIFSDHDPRFGAAGTVGRVPGQVFQNLIHRFSGGVIRFLSVGCGGGTALDVCKKDMNRFVGVNYRGVDIKLSEKVRKEHGDHVVEMDCTKPIEHWDRVCEPEWADMVVITLPLFDFTKTARTQEKTDLGNVINQADYIGLMGAAIAGAYSRLNTHGILVVHSHSTSEFERGEPVADMDWNIVRLIQEHTGFFLARITLVVKKNRVGASPENQPWLNPQAEYLHVYRKV